MESVLQCDTFGSFDSLNFQQNDACFSSILEDFQDRTQLDFGFNFPGETLEFTETTSVGSSSQRRTPNVGEKRKIDSLENFWVCIQTSSPLVPLNLNILTFLFFFE